MSVPSANLFSPVDRYRTIRDQIQHEDNLIVQRLSWLMAAQSFFFTGYAIIANANPQARNALLAKQQDLLFNIIPALSLPSHACLRERDVVLNPSLLLAKADCPTTPAGKDVAECGRSGRVQRLAAAKCPVIKGSKMLNSAH